MSYSNAMYIMKLLYLSRVILLITEYCALSVCSCGMFFRDSVTGIWDLTFNADSEQLGREVCLERK